MLAQVLLASLAVALSPVPAVADLSPSAKKAAPNAEVVLEVRFLIVTDDWLDRLGTDPEANRLRKIVNDSFRKEGKSPTPLNNPQVREFLEKVRADRQCYLRMAPKTRVSDSKTAEVRCTNQLYCLTGIDIVKQGDKTVFHPRCNRVETGLSASIRPRIVEDGRAVRFHLQACLATVEPAFYSKPLADMPITPPQDIERLAMTLPVPILMFNQDSHLSKRYSTCNLIVPDGGTALVGCWKEQRELIKAHCLFDEDEAPAMDRQPKIKNGNAGRKTENILVMVTARIVPNKASRRRERAAGSDNLPK